MRSPGAICSEGTFGLGGGGGGRPTFLTPESWGHDEHAEHMRGEGFDHAMVPQIGTFSPSLGSIVQESKNKDTSRLANPSPTNNHFRASQIQACQAGVVQS